MSFYVTVLSNDILNKNYTNSINTLSNFVNTYSPTIDLDGDYEVSLASIFCHNQYSTDSPDFLHICSDLILPIESQSNVICSIARPKAYNGETRSIYFEPLIKAYYPVCKNTISSIQIIVKPVNQDLTENSASLLAGQPTVVKLHFRKKRMYSPDAVIHVHSKHIRSNELLKDNKAYSFDVSLGRLYNFNPDEVNLEVALGSITYQPKFTLNSNEHLKIQQFDVNNKTKVIWSKVVKPFRGQSIQEYETYIQQEILDSFKLSPDPVELIATLTQDSTGIKKFHVYANKQCVIMFPYALMFNMGERNFVPKEGLSEKDASSNYSYKLTLPGQETPYIFQAGPDPTAFFPDMGFLYCNFIQDVRFGNTSAPIFKSFPIKQYRNGTNYTTYEASTPEYFPLSKYDLTNIHFELKDVTNAFLPFLDNNSNVSLTLFIRNRNKYMNYML